MYYVNISVVGIDVDFYSESKKTKEMYLDNIRRKSVQFGTIILDKKSPSGKGHHFKISLYRKVSFWRSISIRYYLKDDIKRMFYDIMRYRAGGTMIDTLFDQKKIHKYPKEDQKI